MKIVIATPILYNPTSPFNHLFKDILGGLLDDGNQIVRLVAVENINETGYKYGYSDEKIEYKLFKRKRSSHENIVSRYVFDSLTSIRQALAILRLKEVDVLFEDVSYSSFWPVLAAKMKKIKVVAMLQDIWPDNAVKSKLILQNSLTYKYFEMWQMYVYQNSHKIVCISDDMKKFISSKGIKEEKFEVIYNWGYVDDYVEIEWKENKFVKKYDLAKEKFYAIYAGNIGHMQNVELIIKSANILKQYQNIKFLIVGEGAKKESIEKMIRLYDLKNVELLPFQPSDLATSIYSAASVNIIPLVKDGVETALPSKTGIVLSCKKPVIFALGEKSEFARIVDRYKSGYCINEDDAVELASCIMEIFKGKGNIDMNNAMFIDMFTRGKNISKYVRCINE